MAHILCIETASTNCSVALSVNGSVTAFKEDNNTNYSHAERLHSYIEDVLDAGNLTKDQLDAVSVSMGPGSYTGLRIGISAAKGLCFSLDIPLLAIPTLESLAHRVEAENTGLIVSMLDARRMEVYASVFSSEMTEIRSTMAEILDENSFLKYLEQGEVTFIGSGAAKFQEICHHPNARFVDALPSAKELAMLSEVKFQKKDIEDVAYFEPYYLKDFIAGKKVAS